MTRSTSARADAGYDLSKLEAQVEKRLAVTRGRPPIVSLAATMALEHFTAILAHQLLANPRHLDGAERGDGRAVALARGRGDRAQGRRLRHLAARDAGLAAVQALEGQGQGDALVTRNFLVDRTAGALELMRQDGVTGLARLGAAAVVSVGSARACSARSPARG